MIIMVCRVVVASCPSSEGGRMQDHEDLAFQDDPVFM